MKSKGSCSNIFVSSDPKIEGKLRKLSFSFVRMVREGEKEFAREIIEEAEELKKKSNVINIEFPRK